MREMLRQRFVVWFVVAYVLAVATWLLQSTDWPQLRRLVALLALACMIVALVQFFRWTNRTGRWRNSPHRPPK